MQADLQVVRAAFDAFTRKDIEAWFALLDPQVEWIADDLTGPVTYHGHDGVRRWATEIFDDLSDAELEVRELSEGEAGIFIAFDVHARGRASGIAGSVHRGAVATVRDGKMTYYRSYVDEQEAREAAGLASGA